MACNLMGNEEELAKNIILPEFWRPLAALAKHMGDRGSTVDGIDVP